MAERTRRVTQSLKLHARLEYGSREKPIRRVRHGRVVLAGLKGRRAVPELFSDDVIHKALTLKGVLGVDLDSFEQAVQLIESEKYPLEKLHTHSFDVTEAERAIQTLAGAFPDEQAVHIAIVPKP